MLTVFQPAFRTPWFLQVPGSAAVIARSGTAARKLGYQLAAERGNLCPSSQISLRPGDFRRRTGPVPSATLASASRTRNPIPTNLRPSIDPPLSISGRTGGHRG